MKNLKFVLNVLLIIALAITLNFVFASKVNASTTYNSEIAYDERWDDTIEVVANGKYIENATIPSKINGKPVTRVSGFDDCKYLKTVTIPSSVKTLGYSAFENCESLTNVTLPSSITEIGNYAFAGCKSLTSIKIPNSVTTVNNHAFEDCIKLKTVTLGTGFKEIPVDCFAGCTSLSSITFPSNIKKIEWGAFTNCTSLTTVTIPATVTELGGNWYQEGIFAGCTALKSVKVNAKAPKMLDGMFWNCSSLTDVTLSDTITYIGERAFAGCTSLKTITLPSNLTQIDYEGFEGCKNLTTINMGDKLETFDDWVFRNCSSLVSLKFQMGVKKLGNVFENNTNLKNVYFTKGIQEIHEDVQKNINKSKVTFYGYAGTAAKYYAQDNGIKFVECTPVSSIKITGATSVLKKSTTKLTATISPSNAFNKDVTWTSSNTSIATVDKSGNVKGVKAGTATITATAKDGTGVKGTYSVKVILTELPFKDVNVDNWYYTAVKYVYNNKIMNGLSSTKYGPNEKLSRAMMATILYNMSGSPKVSGTSPFKDVKDSKKWYYKAVLWASKNNIVSGYKNGNFGPSDNITREQVAVMLYKYAKYRGKNVSKLGNITTFSDYKNVASYATTQMKWAVGTGVITGSNNKLNPKGNATRAEAASMIYKYCSKVGK